MNSPNNKSSIPPELAVPWEAQGWRRFMGSRRALFVAVAVVIAMAMGWLGLSDFRSALHTRNRLATEANVRRAIWSFRKDYGRCPYSALELAHPPDREALYLNSEVDSNVNQILIQMCTKEPQGEPTP